jgi:hypothetical protein
MMSYIDHLSRIADEITLLPIRGGNFLVHKLARAAGETLAPGSVGL